MTTIEPRGLLDGNKKLAAIGVLACVCHRQPSCTVVAQLEVLVGKLFSVNASTSSSIASSKVATLKHKVGNDTVEDRTLVSHQFAIFRFLSIVKKNYLFILQISKLVPLSNGVDKAA